MLLILFSAEEVEELRLKQRKVDEKRREALSKILDIKGSSCGVDWGFYYMLMYGLKFCYVILIKGLKNFILIFREHSSVL